MVALSERIHPIAASPLCLPGIVVETQGLKTTSRPMPAPDAQPTSKKKDLFLGRGWACWGVSRVLLAKTWLGMLGRRHASSSVAFPRVSRELPENWLSDASGTWLGMLGRHWSGVTWGRGLGMLGHHAPPCSTHVPKKRPGWGIGRDVFFRLGPGTWDAQDGAYSHRGDVSPIAAREHDPHCSIRA